MPQQPSGLELFYPTPDDGASTRRRRRARKPKRSTVEKGSVLDGMSRLFTRILKQVAAEESDREEPAEDLPEDDAAPAVEAVEKADVDDAYLEAQGRLALADMLVGEGHACEYAVERARGYVAKAEDPTHASLRGELTLWPNGPDGLDIQLGLGTRGDRWPGYVAFDTYPYDHGTSVQDLSLGIPLPDGCARSVVVHKALYELSDAPELLRDEIARVLAPGGALLAGGLEEPQWEVINKELGGLFEQVECDAGYVWAVYQPAEVPSLIQKAHPDWWAPIAKASKHEQIVYCVVLEPEFVDSHRDVMDAEDIRKTAHKYLQNSRVVGAQHQKSIPGHPVESYIAPQDLTFEGGPYGKQVVRKGSWVVGLKIDDPKEWKKVVSGEYTGVSIGGFGQRRDYSLVREGGDSDLLVV